MNYDMQPQRRARRFMTWMCALMISVGLALIVLNGRRLEQHTGDTSAQAPIVVEIGAGMLMLMGGFVVLAIMYRPKR